MYIEPNTTIKLYKDVPMDRDYKHTLYFENIDKQNEYFHSGGSGTIAVLNHNYYTRVNRGKIRVQLPIGECYSCNYMAFNNESFRNKWFYAFVTSVEYLNNETVELTFELDVMQTYFFDVTLLESFVERQHSVTDNVGDNLVSEELEIGDIICNDVVKSAYFDDYSIILARAGTQDEEPPVGGYHSGLYSGVKYIIANMNNEQDVSNFTEYLQSIVNANQQESVVSLFMMPSHFASNDALPKSEVAQIPKPNSISGYNNLRNNKLLTYPYKYLAVECGNNSATYRYEWFETNNCNFAEIGNMSCNPRIALVPFGYNGTTSDELNYTEKLVMEGFPQIAFSIDAFRAFLAQEASGTMLNGLTSVAALTGGALTGNALGTVSGAFGLANTINSIVHVANRPNQAKGTNSGSIEVATRTKAFYFKDMQIQPQYAKIIDDYFSFFGYAQRQVMIPNRNARPHWTYLKTRNCNINGDAPSDDLEKLVSIYDKGITFWNNYAEVGNYSLNNSPR